MPSRPKRPPLGKDTQEDPPVLSPLEQLRNAWEFAAFCQYLNIFGQALKIPDSWHTEDLENEILMESPQSYIPRIQMALIRNIFLHKIIREDQFEQNTRALYHSHKPFANPFGEDESPHQFADLPFLTKVQVLHQLSQWTLIHPERLREKLEENSDKDQQQWRMEPCGFDIDENTYFLLDDNRLYRRTPMVVPPTTKSKNSSQSRASRPSKRRKISKSGTASEGAEDLEQEDLERAMMNSMQWSCVCANMEQWLAFVQKLKKSKHPDEKELYKYLANDVMPVLEKAEEDKKKAELKKQKEMALEAAVANRKRSSRVEAQLARQKEEEDKLETERKAREELRRARREVVEKEKITREREKRLVAREKRLKEREMRIAMRQESRNKGTRDESDTMPRSSRRRSEGRSRKEWMFDCICGVHGLNYDDGSQQVACDNCEIWQHVACLNLPPGASAEDKEFVCERCLAQSNGEPGACTSLPHMTIKLRISPPQTTNSAVQFNTALGPNPIKSDEGAVNHITSKHSNATTVLPSSHKSSHESPSISAKGNKSDLLKGIAQESSSSHPLTNINYKSTKRNIVSAQVNTVDVRSEYDSLPTAKDDMAFALSAQPANLKNPVDSLPSFTIPQTVQVAATKPLTPSPPPALTQPSTLLQNASGAAESELLQPQPTLSLPSSATSVPSSFLQPLPQLTQI